VEIEQLSSFQFCTAGTTVFCVAGDVTQNCGMRKARFKLNSEARGPQMSETLRRLAVN
jgi:hypothetical protein